MVVPQSIPNRYEVAVVVPCYNVEGYLQRALDSVCAQTFKDFCIYAVDDSSTDRTLEVLEANGRQCSFVSQPHAGPAAARNRAIEMSQSDFIAFLDADDEWLPIKLERQIALLKKDPTLGMVCSLCGISEPGREVAATFVPEGIPCSGKLFRYLARNCFVFTPTVVVRRSCLADVGLFNESLAVSEDFNLWLRVAARWRIACLPEVLAVTHKRSGSLSVVISPEERLRNGVAALEHVQANSHGLARTEARALRAALSERLYFYGSHLLSTGANAPSRRELASAFKLQPMRWRAVVKFVLSFLPGNVVNSFFQLKARLLNSWFSRALSSSRNASYS
jgi:glycosyltransferase involved in cell wall biosynthesis